MMDVIARVWRPLCVVQFAVLLVIYTYLSLTSTPGDYVPVYNDKLMHFTGYFVAGLSITFAFPNMPIWQRWLLLVAYSTGIEVAQHFMPPRTFSWLDILANTAGAATGLAVFEFARRLAPRWSKLLLQNS
jgi:VanZ family protein